MKHYDAIVIGSGQGGTPLAKKLAKAGFHTALIEKRYAGGTCVNDGCTPTKTMIADAAVAHIVRNADKHGVHIHGQPQINIQEIIHRKNEVVYRFRRGTEKGIEETNGLEMIYGEAVFTGNKQLHITCNDGNSLDCSADKIFINTGTRTQIPDIPGLHKIPYLTSTSLLDITVIPAHLIILGAGYIGLELGQLFRRLGSEVSIIETAERLLPKEDEDVSKAIRSFLEEEQITFHLPAKVSQVEAAADGISVTLDNGTRLNGSHLLVAAGRTPQTDRLQPRASGIELDNKGFVKVNEYLETNVKGIYALGDVKGGPAFTHIAYNDHLVLVKQILDNQPTSIKDRVFPYCMFTDPQLGRVGITEQEARQQGLSIKVACLPMSSTARAIETGQTTGLMKAVVDASTKKILGAAILGPNGGEIMSILQIAMKGNITYEEIREQMFAHPLLAESLNNLFMTLDA
ncbi:mercuric reductase [Chitinophaga pendula]|uniref:mercuric reductase n=1 Tax=Chitinophaga TaxID=79328 RepID=UPI000BAFFFAF|nr:MULTISPECIES: mercuric reductase [Chitinophaga]ASZ12368.1 mercuric reductase [Chitinophaga sp. MD30]UCJ10036.1 mercuric reductase [Chitinophaga pendula]